jgi:hypothetical protein
MAAKTHSGRQTLKKGGVQTLARVSHNEAKRVHTDPGSQIPVQFFVVRPAVAPNLRDTNG